MLPGVWVGLLIGLAFIETPLKFLAPDVTTEIALGIGRLVLTAADIAGVLLLAGLTLVSALPPRVERGRAVALGALWLVLLIQVAVVRPLLNARTDVILSGRDAGESPLHAFYVIADVLLIVGLIIYIVFTARNEARRSE